MMRADRFIFLGMLAVLPACGHDDPTQPVVIPPPQEAKGAAISIDPSKNFQTIVGWEATAEAGEIECSNWGSYKSGVLDRIVNEVGINRLRLEIRSGSEGDKDWFALWQAGSISRDEWRAHRYAPVNDNSDPSVIAPGGFHFTNMDRVIEEVVNPVRQRLAARGEALYVNLNYVDFANTAFEHKTNPAEYAEFLLATFQHIRSSYGWTPDAIEIILEPDNTNWTGADIGRAIVATGDRLKAAGFSPDFIAPSTTNMTTSLAYVEQLIAVPRVREYITDIAYHRYSGVSLSSLQNIAQRAASLGLRTAMLEHIGSGYQDLHADLGVGRNSSWQQYVVAGCGGDGSQGGAHIAVTGSGANVEYVMGTRTRLLRQYFLFVRAGAVRIGATSAAATFEPLAFRNTDGGYVVVVKADGAGEFHVKGLPSGTYGVKYATASEWDIDAPDAILGDGYVLNASIPAAGVLTIYRR